MTKKVRRLAAMLVASLVVSAGVSLAGAAPASADEYGVMGVTTNGDCLSLWNGVPMAWYCRVTEDYSNWALEIVSWVGDSPRYRLRNIDTNTCLAHFASNGRVGMYRCNSAWADQVWGFHYYGLHNGRSVFRLQNKHSGKCLAMNVTYAVDVFATTCAHYGDQLWYAPGQAPPS